MIKLVIFDLDGTLYDYEKCNEFAEIELKNEISKLFQVSTDEAGQLLTNAKRNVKNQLGDVAAAHNRLLYMQNICEQKGEKPLKYAMQLYNCYWDTMLEQMQLFSYVKPVLDMLHERKVFVGILTDLTAHIQYRKLERLQLLNDIDYITTSEEAGEEKPSQKMFKKMVEKAKVAPEEALMIGDSKSKDVQGAIEAGIKSIWYKPGMNLLREIECILQQE